MNYQNTNTQKQTMPKCLRAKVTTLVFMLLSVS